MKQSLFMVQSNRQIARDLWEMTLLGDTDAITAPGQFVNLRLNGYYLRRPLSVCNWEKGVLTLIYKVVGQGTQTLSACVSGDVLDILTGLGNGYDLSKSGDQPLLIGGGAGVPPMYALAKQLIAQGKKVQVILGFGTEQEAFYLREFAQLGASVRVTTVDGSLGVKGFVTDALPEEGDYSYVYTCGPEPMLKAVWQRTGVSGQYSFEERMGCGFGACMGCSCKTLTGNKRICREGPVLEKEEILWPTHA